MNLIEKVRNLAKGQGSLEYLLIIGGAIAIAAIVIYLVLSSTGSGNEASAEQQRRALIAEECAGACADASYCGSDTNLECGNQCKAIGYANSEINTSDCRWDCTASSNGSCTTATNDFNTQGAWQTR